MLDSIPGHVEGALQDVGDLLNELVEQVGNLLGLFFRNIATIVEQRFSSSSFFYPECRIERSVVIIVGVWQ